MVESKKILVVEDDKTAAALINAKLEKAGFEVTIMDDAGWAILKVLKVDFDLTMTILAQTLYKLLANQLVGFEKENAKSIYINFIHNGADIEIRKNEIHIKMLKKSHNPIIMSSEIFKRAVVLSNKRGLGPKYMAIFVHDSIDWDGDVMKQVPVEELENIPGFRIPFELKQTFRWE